MPSWRARARTSNRYSKRIAFCYSTPKAYEKSAPHEVLFLMIAIIFDRFRPNSAYPMTELRFALLSARLTKYDRRISERLLSDFSTVVYRAFSSCDRRRIAESRHIRQIPTTVRQRGNTSGSCKRSADLCSQLLDGRRMRHRKCSALQTAVSL